MRSGVRQIMRDRAIGELIGWDGSVVWREHGRNSLLSGGSISVSADTRAECRRRRRHARLIGTDSVLAPRGVLDLKRSRTPQQIAGRLRLM